MSFVKEVAKKLRERPLEEQKEYFSKTVEAIRAAAMGDGTAIDK